jgi:hypothetical protein
MEIAKTDKLKFMSIRLELEKMLKGLFHRAAEQNNYNHKRPGENKIQKGN